MNLLERASNPDLSPAEFKELLDLQNLEVYEALDLNKSAADRYLAWLDTQPEIDYFPYENLSVQEVERLANSGDHRAQFNMAINCHEQGDTAGTSEWFRRSAENGNIICAFNYGLTLPSQEDQITWFKRAAFRGMPEAQRELGKIYFERNDILTSKIWFSLAIRRDSVQALNDLGVLHWFQNESDEAIECWNRAAAQGNSEAQDNLNMALNDTIFDEDDLDFDYGDLGASPVQQASYQPPASTEIHPTRTGLQIL